MDNKDIIKSRLEDILIHYGARKGTGKNWDCITARHKSQKSCKNDLSIKGTGINQVCCCHCGLQGDSFNVISIIEGITDFKELISRACEILGIEVDISYNPPIKKELTIPLTPSTDNSSLIESWHCNVSDTDYFANRGLSDDIINKYRLGYNPNGGYYGKAFKYSLPISPNCVVFREEGNLNGRYRNTIGEVEILNLDYVSSDNYYIYICEGVFDALSIETLGYKSISLNSTSNYNTLMSAVEENIDEAKKKTFIIVTDNDETGEKLKEKAIKAFNEIGVKVESFNISTDYNDINEYLITDKTGLEASLKSFISDITEDLFVVSNMDTFFKTIKKNKSEPIISSGFFNLDAKMGGGFYPGLYTLGGISALGKTTLALQMADDMAKNNHAVLFFTLEMSRNDLIARSLSRHLYSIDKVKCRYVGTTKILRGKIEGIEDELNIATKNYINEEGRNLSIHEGNFDTNIDTIRHTIEMFIARTGRKPIVYIDYLQILKGKGQGSDKQEMDFVAVELKRISRDCDIPIIVISSLSRANYYTPIGMEAFKESGSIEYTSDVLIGLQLSILSELDFADKNKTNNKSAIMTAMDENPRKITVKLLKQRNASSDQSQDFIFYPINNLMQEVK